MSITAQRERVLSGSERAIERSSTSLSLARLAFLLYLCVSCAPVFVCICICICRRLSISIHQIRLPDSLFVLTRDSFPLFLLINFIKTSSTYSSGLFDQQHYVYETYQKKKQCLSQFLNSICSRFVQQNTKVYVLRACHLLFCAATQKLYDTFVYHSRSGYGALSRPVGDVLVDTFLLATRWFSIS